jgi:hypothetical protein
MTIDFNQTLRFSVYGKGGGPLDNSDYLGLSTQPKFLAMLGTRKPSLTHTLNECRKVVVLRPNKEDQHVQLDAGALLHRDE